MITSEFMANELVRLFYKEFTYDPSAFSSQFPQKPSASRRNPVQKFGSQKSQLCLQYTLAKRRCKEQWYWEVRLHTGSDIRISNFASEASICGCITQEAVMYWNPMAIRKSDAMNEFSIISIALTDSMRQAKIVIHNTYSIS